LKDLGKYIHTTPQGLAILKLKIVPSIGEGVIDEKGRQIGQIADVFGPVASPYGSVKLFTGTSQPQIPTGTELYLAEAKRNPKRGTPGRP